MTVQSSLGYIYIHESKGALMVVNMLLLWILKYTFFFLGEYVYTVFFW